MDDVMRRNTYNVKGPIKYVYVSFDIVYWRGYLESMANK